MGDGWMLGVGSLHFTHPVKVKLSAHAKEGKIRIPIMRKSALFTYIST